MPALLIREVEFGGEVTNLFVDGNHISVAKATPQEEIEIIDGRGLTALPGPIDVHVHFRDPGLTEQEDLLTGARAAAAGGIPTVLCEPNTCPVIDTAKQVSIFYERTARLKLPLTVLTKAAVSMGEQGEILSDIYALKQAKAVGLSDDGEPIVNRELLTSALREANALVISVHCEETPRSANKVRATLGGGPTMAREVDIIRENLQALQDAGCGRLHIQHVSLAQSVELIAAAKRSGLSVTAEATPHHLLLCAEEIPYLASEADANWKMNPPLRSKADMMALRKALAAGIIDMVATDHAPHTMANKALGWEKAPFGIIGLETALGAYLSLVREGVITLERLIAATSAAPARLLPLWAAPLIAGSLTLVDLKAKWIVDPNTFFSKSRNCPFAGREFTGKTVCTISRGQIVFRDGAVCF